MNKTLEEKTKEEEILEALGPNYSELTPYGEGTNRDTYTVRWSPAGQGYETRFVRVDKQIITNGKAKNNHDKGYNTAREVELQLRLTRSEDRPEAHNLEALLDAKTREIEGEEKRISVTTYFPETRTLQKRVEEEGPLGIKDYYKVFEGVIKADKYLHEQGLFHRDLTPRNILVTSKGKGIVVDLALAKKEGEMPTDGNKQTALGYSLSDPRLEERGTDYDSQAEIFSIGANMYYALTGRFLDKQDIKEALKKTPRRIRGVIEQCVTPDLKRRFSGIEELAKEFEKQKRREEQGIIKRTSLRLGIPLLMGLAGLVGLTGSNVEQKTEEQKYQVTAQWNGEGLTIGNGLLSMQAEAVMIRKDYHDNDSSEDGHIIVNEEDYKEGKAQLSLHVTSQRIPIPRTGKEISTALSLLPFRAYIEGEKEVIEGSTSPSDFDKSKLYQSDMGYYGGNNYIHIPLPSWNEVKGTVRNLAVEIVSPNKQKPKNVYDDTDNLDFPEEGTVIERKVIPVIFGREISDEQRLRLKYLAISGYRNNYGIDTFAGKEKHTTMKRGIRVITETEKEGEINRNEQSYSSNSIWGNIHLKQPKGIEEDFLRMGIYDTDGRLISWAGAPIESKRICEGTYWYDLGTRTKDLPQQLHEAYQSLPKQIEPYKEEEKK